MKCSLISSEEIWAVGWGVGEAVVTGTTGVIGWATVETGWAPNVGCAEVSCTGVGIDALSFTSGAGSGVVGTGEPKSAPGPPVRIQATPNAMIKSPIIKRYELEFIVRILFPAFFKPAG
jgi:hypothetical protein